MDNVIESAKSGRASCRTCRKKIDKGSLRFGEAAENQFDPDGGMTLRWHHLECAAKQMPEKVKPALDAFDGDVPNRAQIDAALASGKKKAAAQKSFPYAEKAPTGRSRCIECGEPIEKDTWRVAVEREIDAGGFQRTGAGYLHPACSEVHADWDQVEENSGLDEAELADLRNARGE